MTHASAGRSDVRDNGRTPAQWYCLIVGAVLLLVGAFGFVSDSEFDTGQGIDGDLFLGFEVNGIHNLVHVASGLVLLAASPRRAPARAVALAFGVVYGVVAIIGLVDGTDVLGLFPVNAADNVLHIALSLLGIVAGLISPDRDRALERGSGTRLRRDTEPTSRERAGR